MARRQIKGIMYDTDESELIAAYSHGQPGSLWADWGELRRTRRGDYFLYCGGGAGSQWSVPEFDDPGWTRGARWIIAVTPEIAASWLAANDLTAPGLPTVSNREWRSFYIVDWNTGRSEIGERMREV